MTRYGAFMRAVDDLYRALAPNESRLTRDANDYALTPFNAVWAGWR